MVKTKSQRKALFSCFFVILLLSGCASSPIELTNKEPPAPGEGIIFGRVQLVENGKEKTLSFLGESKFGLFIMPGDSSESMYVPLEGEGSFAWRLPAGGYTIASFDWRASSTLAGPVYARFKVAEGRATYIGTLSITFAGYRYVLDVLDDESAAAKHVLAEFPGLSGTISKDLMHMEKRR
ncbi:MAG: hypothetical protein RQ754_14435 [Desulfuromonadales bacterium]|nr:hypothetical protein [Desulfuromonadales bacterium]